MMAAESHMPGTRRGGRQKSMRKGASNRYKERLWFYRTIFVSAIGYVFCPLSSFTCPKPLQHSPSHNPSNRLHLSSLQGLLIAATFQQANAHCPSHDQVHEHHVQLLSELSVCVLQCQEI